MSTARRCTGASAVALLALAYVGGCQSIYGIGDLPQTAPDADVSPTEPTPTEPTPTPTPTAPTPTSGSCPPVTGACTKVNVAPLPPNGGPACAGTAFCSPDDVTLYAPPWIPPVPRLGQCTPVQIAAFLAACVDAPSNSPACGAWEADSHNATCFGCLVSEPTAATYGASVRVPGSGSFQLNAPGCLALAEPCNQPCAEALLDEILCGYASCNPYPGQNCEIFDDASRAEQQACLIKATTPATPSCACMGYATPASCGAAITGPAATKCAGKTPRDAFVSIATFMCGPC